VAVQPLQTLNVRLLVHLHQFSALLTTKYDKIYYDGGGLTDFVTLTPQQQLRTIL